MTADDLPPIRHQLTLACSAVWAFQVYVGQIGVWWDARYTANSATLTAVTIEPQVGGRVFATHSDVGVHDWGVVTLWEPGRRLAHTFTLAQDPTRPSLVSMTCVPSADDRERCTVHVEHGDWSADAAQVRAKFSDWPLLLGRFAALAQGRDSGGRADSLRAVTPDASIRGLQPGPEDHRP